MDIKATLQDVEEAFARVEHPEISRTLVELGMLRDVSLDADARQVSLTLVLPMLQIPEAVRDYMINSLQQALVPLDLTLHQVELDAMDDAQRASFFEQSQANWKA